MKALLCVVMILLLPRTLLSFSVVAALNILLDGMVFFFRSASIEKTTGNTSLETPIEASSYVEIRFGARNLISTLEGKWLNCCPRISLPTTFHLRL